ncbi:DUF411 domain-containing protein [Paludibacterium paludis]|uniref:CopG family transcriptional regulator n=1 Tax=Paludibacterium paludis TaxID=1225769 RepID=A0A918P685_9NEIS|nr:DUF411 domain-containing protein [Paludibacterium paludis]GGY25241.1 hypothetical protein GCM10011289_31000 [Paludibacterium paludis]
MSVLRLFLSAAVLSVSSSVAFAAIPATVYKSPTCGCCEAYIAYLNQHGFKVRAINSDDMNGIKKRLGVTPGMGSCHTVEIAGYAVEGHVPVAAIRKLLVSRPKVTGIAVPGMPQNSPGMGVEQPGALPVYTMTRDQRTDVLFGRF